MTQRDWKKDMEMCEATTKGPWIAKAWTVPTADQYNITSEHDNSELYTAWQGTRYPGGPEVSAYQAKLNAIFAAESRTALPYWLQEAKERGEREQEIKRAIGRCLVAGNSLGSIIMNYNLPEGHEEWSFQEANSYFFGKFYNDRPSAYESYETWIAWKAIMGASEIMSTLYPDTPAPKEGES
ncbi:hypothetical protein [Paenibacillus sp. FSL H3-0286]|uniref:hypothetical protein n=1 Tax=Paenibacillus sp. FSL H3-0286 TaxID=2921427 RepID=UPI003247665D